MSDLLVKLINGIGPLGKLLKPVIPLVKKLLGTGHGFLLKNGILGKLLSGGNTKYATMDVDPKTKKPLPFNHKVREQLYHTLYRTLGPYTARSVVMVLAMLFNGAILNKIPIGKIVIPILNVVEKVLKFLDKVTGCKGLVGRLVFHLLSGKQCPPIKGDGLGGLLSGVVGGATDAVEGATSALGGQ